MREKPATKKEDEKNYGKKEGYQGRSAYNEKVNKEEGRKDTKQGNRSENAPVPKVKAWGNPEEAAEILKKPKEDKIITEEISTKQGFKYYKKSYQEGND